MTVLSGIVACTPMADKIAQIQAHHRLEQYRERLAEGYFDTVIAESEQILKENDHTPPADLALYNLGEAYANRNFPGMDLALSRDYFQRLVEKFPESPLAEEARMYLQLLETIAAKDRAIASLQWQRRSVQSPVPPPAQDGGVVTAAPPIVEDGNFAAAIRKNLLLWEKLGTQKPADRALYHLGLIFASEQNPEKDYKKAQKFFQLLIEKFPESDLVEEAQVWLGVFAAIEKMQQIDVDIEQQKKKLTR